MNTLLIVFILVTTLLVILLNLAYMLIVRNVSCLIGLGYVINSTIIFSALIHWTFIDNVFNPNPLHYIIILLLMSTMLGSSFDLYARLVKRGVDIKGRLLTLFVRTK